MPSFSGLSHRFRDYGTIHYDRFGSCNLLLQMNCQKNTVHDINTIISVQSFITLAENKGIKGFINMGDIDGKTPLEIAVALNHFEVTGKHLIQVAQLSITNYQHNFASSVQISN